MRKYIAQKLKVFFAMLNLDREVDRIDWDLIQTRAEITVLTKEMGEFEQAGQKYGADYNLRSGLRLVAQGRLNQLTRIHQIYIPIYYEHNSRFWRISRRIRNFISPH